MSELRPLSFTVLLHRLMRELELDGPVFGLPRRDWHMPRPDLDLSFTHAGRRAANPLGPAAGPHTQLAPNIAQGWLAGARVFELKTIQVLDRLRIARPCIHVPHYGLNVEWSQELTLNESVREYQKAAWLVEILRRTRAGGALPEESDLATVLDLSVGYSLEGIRSPAMMHALAGLRHPETGWRDLMEELPGHLRRWAGEPPAGPLADCITLSTFHGCPPGEIEAIAGHLLDEGWSVIVKLNPTLLGLEDTRRLLHEALGFHHLRPDPAAFEHDLDLEGAVALMGRLRRKASALGLSLGAKFTNTLVLQRDGEIFPADAGPHMYLSGLPLHPLALGAAARFACAMPAPLPLSFSAGLDKANVVDTLACGFAPVTLCTELLRRGGQGRLSGMLRAVEARLEADGSQSLRHWLGLAANPCDLAGWDQTRRRLTLAADKAVGDPRYGAARVMRSPRQMDRRLERLDCISCDICLPVCPNGAIFSWATPADSGLGETHQIGVLADACNACSNCETWCPEEGAPWRVKERWHQDRSSLDASPADLDGCCLEGRTLLGRFNGQVVRLSGDAALDAGSFQVDDVVWKVRRGVIAELPEPHRQGFERLRLVWRGLAWGMANPVSLMRDVNWADL